MITSGKTHVDPLPLTPSLGGEGEYVSNLGQSPSPSPLSYRIWRCTPSGAAFDKLRLRKIVYGIKKILMLSLSKHAQRRSKPSAAAICDSPALRGEGWGGGEAGSLAVKDIH